MSEALTAVQARVAQLQSLLAPAAPVTRPTSSTATAAQGATTSGSGFGGALAAALGQPVAASGAPTSPGATDVGGRALTLASGYTGVPYRWGGTDPSTGLDCSGLTQLVYRKLGVELPRVAADQARAGTAVPSLDQARPGDLVFFGSPAHHVGVYAGGGKMVDAPHRGATVGLHPLWSTPSSIRRVAATAPNPLAAASFGASPAAAAPGAPAAGAPAAGAAGLRGPYADLFTAAGRRYGVDPALLSAVARTESGYAPGAVSGAGARGLMQLMPGTARSLGVDPTDPPQAVDGAARLLSGLLQQFGRTDLALAAYNAGPGAVRRYGGIPPYAETRTYVRRVTDAWEALS